MNSNLKKAISISMDNAFNSLDLAKIPEIEEKFRIAYVDNQDQVY